MGKIYRNARQVITAKKRWRRPHRSEVLIFDACNHAPLLPFIAHHRPSILSIRWEEINLPILLRSLFRPGNRMDAYIDAFIEAVDPRIIVTFIDNTPGFYRIKTRHPHRVTLFIQNGWRSYKGDVFEHLDVVKDAPLSVDYMLCFNAVVAGRYQQYIQGNTLAIGSLKNNSYARRYDPEPGAIAYVSQWIEDGLYLGAEFYSQEEIIGRVDRLILPALRDHTRRRAASLYIIPRTLPDSPKRLLEKAYFDAMLEKPCQFLEYREPGSSYRAIDSVEVVVGADSTLAYESLARGNKTAVFSIRGQFLSIPGYNFGWPADFPDEGPFWTNLPDTRIFSRILDSLFALSGDEWQKLLKDFWIDELMAYDPGNKKLTALLEKI